MIGPLQRPLPDNTQRSWQNPMRQAGFEPANPASVSVSQDSIFAKSQYGAWSWAVNLLTSWVWRTRRDGKLEWDKNKNYAQILCVEKQKRLGGKCSVKWNKTHLKNSKQIKRDRRKNMSKYYNLLRIIESFAFKEEKRFNNQERICSGKLPLTYTKKKVFCRLV